MWTYHVSEERLRAEQQAVRCSVLYSLASECTILLSLQAAGSGRQRQQHVAFPALRILPNFVTMGLISLVLVGVRGESCGFHLHFPDDEGCHASLHVFLGYYFFFFLVKCVFISSPAFDCLVGLYIAEL